jgi:hypothetical protein
MSALEGLSVEVIEELRKNREAGLINPELKIFYKLPRPSHAEYEAFDARYNQSVVTEHRVFFHDKQVRLDLHQEYGVANSVRSVVVEDTDHPDNDDEGVWCWSVNIIDDGEGPDVLVEVHHSKEKDGVILWEPSVGSADVHIGEYVDLDLWRQVAFDAPLPQVA